jgi:hypothetical protein
MTDLNDVHNFRLRRPIDALDLWRLDRPAEKHAGLEIVAFRPHEEIARLARKHDRMVRGVDSLIPERHRGLAQPLPCVLQILGEICGQRRFRRRPAIVRFAFFDPLFAVITLAPDISLSEKL